MTKKVDKWNFGSTGGRFDFPAMRKNINGVFVRTEDYEILEKKYRRIQGTVRDLMYELDFGEKLLERIAEDNYKLIKEKREKKND